MEKKNPAVSQDKPKSPNQGSNQESSKLFKYLKYSLSSYAT